MLDGTYLMIAVFGFILWVFGHKRIKTAIGVVGMISGAIGAGLGVSYTLPMLQPMPWLMIGIICGSMAGVFFGLFLMRIWVSVLLALIAAILAPWCVAAWRGPTATPEASTPLSHIAVPIIETTIKTDITGDGQVEQRPIKTVLIDAAKDTAIQWRDWWTRLGKTAQLTILSISTVAAIVGLIIGLIMPTTAAMIVSSILGSFMILSAVNRLIGHIKPDNCDIMLASPRHMLISLVLTATIGVVFQWMISRQSADN